MSNFQGRFEEEINRIGVSAVAERLGVARNTIYNWIAKANAPMNSLIALNEMGVDVAYVLFGARSVDSLSQDEQELLKLFRGAALAVKAAAIGALQSGTNSQPKISVGGRVEGQVVEGGLINNAPITFGGKTKNKK